MKKIIVVIEDKDADRELLRQELSGWNGCVTVFVANGYEASQVVKGVRIDCLVVSVLPEKITGFTKLKATLASSPIIPIVVYTGHPNPQPEFTSLRVDQFVTKNSNLDHLKEAIYQYLT